MEVDVEEEEGVEVDLWVSAEVLLIVQIGPQYAASLDFVKHQINLVETQTLESVDQVEIVHPGHQTALGLDIANSEEAAVVVVEEEAGAVPVVENVEKENQDHSLDLLEADQKVLVEEDAGERVVEEDHPRTELQDLK